MAFLKPTVAILIGNIISALVYSMLPWWAALIIFPIIALVTVTIIARMD